MLLFLWAVFTFVALVSASPLEKRTTVIRNGFYPLDIVDKLEEATMPKVQEWMATKNTTCTVENAAVRREWSNLSVSEREDYIKAVLCLQSKPAKVPTETAPVAKSRFDDFVAFRMTQAMMLHDTTHLLVSHRYFIWAWGNEDARPVRPSQDC